MNSAVAGDLANLSSRKVGTETVLLQCFWRHQRWFLSGIHQHQVIVSRQATQEKGQALEALEAHVSYGHL